MRQLKSIIQCKLDKNNFNVLLPYFNIPISIKILCNFTKRYREETEIFEISSNEFLTGTKRENGKKIYIYDKVYNIDKIFDYEKLESLEDNIANFMEKIKFYPFMINYQINFNYAALIIHAEIGSRIFYNPYNCKISYILNDKEQVFQRHGILGETIIFYSPIFSDCKKIAEFAENFDVKIYVN